MIALLVAMSEISARIAFNEAVPSDKKKPAHYSGMRREGQKVFDKLFNVGIPTTAIRTGYPSIL